jgi:hypothetical protein
MSSIAELSKESVVVRVLRRDGRKAAKKWMLMEGGE